MVQARTFRSNVWPSQGGTAIPGTGQKVGAGGAIDANNFAKYTDEATLLADTSGERDAGWYLENGVVVNKVWDRDTNQWRDADEPPLYVAGDFQPSTGAFPSVDAGGDPIRAGAVFRATDAGTVGGVDITAGDTITAIVGTPSTTTLADNWKWEPLAAELLTDPQAQDRTDVDDGTVTGKLLFDREQAIKGAGANIGDAVEGLIAKPWAADELNRTFRPLILVETQTEAQTTDVLPGQAIRIGSGPNLLGIFVNYTNATADWTNPGAFVPYHEWKGALLATDGASPAPDNSRLWFSDWTIGTPADPTRERSHYYAGVLQATEAEWGAMTTVQAKAVEIVWDYYQSMEDPSSPGNFVWVKEKAASTLPVEMRTANNEPWVGAGVVNGIFQDDNFDPATLLPTPVLGEDIAVLQLPADRADALTAPETMEGDFHAWSCIDLGNGPFWLKTRSPKPHDHEVLENIAVHVRSAGTNAGSAVDIELLLDGAWNPTDWVVSTAPGGLTAHAGPTVLNLDRAAITGPINIGHNKDGWLFFEYIGDATEGQLTGVNYTGANNANSDGEIIVNFTGTNQAVTFDDKASVVATALEFEQPEVASDLEIVRYTADGAIEDRDHRAIFETGANNMTLPVSSQDRLIQIISEGPATIITADGAEQFTGPGGTTTDGTLNVNETFQWATLLGRGAAAGWSQYVGQVATAQSVGAMVDFSESPGPGDAGSFTLALTNSGANLRYILTLTCSNGTNFSPPLDVDDGTNRWWYDFDHTTGVVNIRRFGAFAGGSVRGVALYS